MARYNRATASHGVQLRRTTIPKVRIELEITPWTDRAFVDAVERVAKRVQRTKGVDPVAFVGAELAQTFLRAAGYPRVRVIDRRTVDEAMERIIHWTVLRDGEAS